MINIRQNISLKDYSSMKLGGKAKYLCQVTTRMDLLEALSWAQKNNLKTIMIGGGNNIIWSDDGFNGLLIVNKISGLKISNDRPDNFYLTIGSGENWDKIVEQTVNMGLTGIEALSSIPGTVGATVIQNIGAYGQEIVDSLLNVEAFDIKISDYVILSASQCLLGYRSSLFKNHEPGRYLISAITINLKKQNPAAPFYSVIEEYIKEHQINEITPQILRQIVQNIRAAKLPDPNKIANCGSFFVNPIISYADFFLLQKTLNQQIPHWKHSEESLKISAAWLIEFAGFKDYHDWQTGMATWEKQPLILINEKAHSTADLEIFRDKIIKAVHQKTGITLIQEPEILPLITR